MKKLLLLLLPLLLLCTHSPAHATEKCQVWPVYGALTGGGSGSLDGAISGVSIGKNDIAFVVLDGRAWIFSATTSACTDDGEYCIAPDDVGAGTTRWELAQYALSGNTIPTIIIPEPDQLDDLNEHPIWKNTTGTTYYITSVAIVASDSGATCDLQYTASETDLSWNSGVSIAGTFWPDTAGTNCHYGSITSGVTPILPNRWVIMDFGSGTPDWMAITISGYYSFSER